MLLNDHLANVQPQAEALRMGRGGCAYVTGMPSARWNGSQMRACSSGGRPGP